SVTVTGLRTATITSLTSDTIHTHTVSLAGTVSDNGGGNVPTGTTVTVTFTGPATVSCTASTLANQTWQCSSAVNLPADGFYTATATVQQFDGSNGPGNSVYVTADT